MEKRTRANRRTKLIPRRYVRVAVIFTRKIWLFCLLLATAIIVIPAWRGWQASIKIKTTEAKLRQVISLEEAYKNRDQMLTMSLSMAAATGESEWLSRFEELGQRINPVIDETLDISQESNIRADVVLTTYAENQLRIIESNALKFVRQGNNEDATILLQSLEYQEQKDEYNRGMNAFVTVVRKTLQERYDSCWRNSQNALIAISIILPGIVLIWLGTGKVGKYFHMRLKKQQNEGSLGREWQETFNAITDGVCIIDKDAKTILQCNRAMTRFLKKPYSEIIGRNCCELIHGSPEPVRKCPLMRMRQTLRSEAIDFQVGEKWLNIKADPLIDNDGNLIGAVHIISDITEQRKANKALRESENKFRLAFANAQDAIIWIESESGLIANCNKASEELFGRRTKDLIGRHHTTVYPDNKKDSYQSLLSESKTDMSNILEAEILRKGGEIRSVTITTSTMLVDGHRIIQGIIRDVTESKKAIQEVRNLARFPSEDPNPVLRISKDCDILYANDASKPVLQTWQ
ncbi:PAS domain-containing protein, partial [Planctomycetota bacterium]